MPTLTITTTTAISATGAISYTKIIARIFLDPAATITTWCGSTFGTDGWGKAQTDSAPIVVGVSSAFGWLAIFQILGPLSWLLPPILITLLIRIIRAILSLIKYIKQIIPVVG
jgi:hypothetical protein